MQVIKDINVSLEYLMGSFIICMFPCWHWLTCGPGWALLQLYKRHNIILLNIMALKGTEFLGVEILQNYKI